MGSFEAPRYRVCYYTWEAVKATLNYNQLFRQLVGLDTIITITTADPTKVYGQYPLS